MFKKGKKAPSTFMHTVNTITMLIIILSTATSRLGDTAPFRKILFSFHMPLFFLVSGLVLDRKKGSWVAFEKMLGLKYAVPYFLWALIYSVFSYRHLGWILYGSCQALDKAQTLIILCFMTTMLVARNLVELALEVINRPGLKNRYYGLCAALLFFAVGILLPKIESIGYPWNCNVAFTAAGFLMLGYALRDVIEKEAKKLVFIIAAFAVSLIIFCCGTVLRMDQLDMVYLRSGDYGNIFWFFVNALSGSILVVSLSMLIKQTWKNEGSLITERDEAGISPVTLGTFVIHMPLMLQVILPLLSMIPVNLPPIILFLAAMVLTKFISGKIIKFVARYVPQLFGMIPNPAVYADIK